MMSLKERALKGGGSAGRLAVMIGDLPVDAVAREAGLDRSTIRHHLRGDGKRGPSWATVDAVQRAVAHLRESDGG